MGCCDAAFRPLLADLDLPALDLHAGSIFGLWADLSLAYMNAAWFQFSAENGGEPGVSRDWGPGANLIDAISPAMSAFYLHGYGRSLRTGAAWSHEYECSSADRYRRFLQIVYPLRGEAFLVVNSPTVNRLHERRPDDATLAEYLDADGTLHRCAHCGRVYANRPHDWHWAPAWATLPEKQVTVVVCEICLEKYYAR